jgi:ABC-2 type transport system permease protein
LFLTLAAVIASIATTQEDYQQYQAPLVFLLLGGYYIGIFLPLLGAQSVVKVFAYIPFFSTIIAPIAYLQGLLPLWQTLLSLGVLLFTTVFFLYFVGPLYRVAILSYEETKFFKRIKLYFKKAFKS